MPFDFAISVCIAEKRRATSGFSLVELAVVLVILGMLVAMPMSIYGKYRTYQDYERARLELYDAMDGVRYFFYRYNRLPCPSPSNAVVGDSGYLRELDCGALAKHSHALKDGGGYVVAGERGELIIAGHLPVYDLSVEDKDGVDPWGRPFIYVVTLKLAEGKLVDQEPGAIRVVNASNQSLNWKGGDAQFAIVSSGPGGCPSTGADGSNCLTELTNVIQKRDVRAFSDQSGS